MQTPNNLTLKRNPPILQSPLDVGKYVKDAGRDLSQGRLAAECFQSGHPTVGARTGDVGQVPSKDAVGLAEHDHMSDSKLAGRVSRT